MQVFSPVSLVFTLHMIRNQNRKNRNRIAFFFSKNRPKPTANSQMETVTALYFSTCFTVGSLCLMFNTYFCIMKNVYSRVVSFVEEKNTTAVNNFCLV